jgi:hypothetical protein
MHYNPHQRKKASVTPFAERQGDARSAALRLTK